MEGNIGAEGNYKYDFADGKVILAVGYVGDHGEAKLELSVSLVDLLRLAASKTDNSIDDALVEMIAKAIS